MKKYIFLSLLLFSGITLAQTQGQVLTNKQRTAVNDLIDEKLDTAGVGILASAATLDSIVIDYWNGNFINKTTIQTVNINQYIGVIDTSLGWSSVIQAAIDANLGSGKQITFNANYTYDLQELKANPYTGYGGHRTCIDLKTGGFSLIIPAGSVLKLKDGEQVNGAPVDMIVFENASGLYIGGGGTIMGNTAGQTGWTGGYDQIANGLIIAGYGSARGDNKDIIIEDLTLIDHFSNPIDISYADGITVKNITTYDVGEGISFNFCDNLFIDGYTANDNNAVMIGDVLQLEVVRYFHLNNLNITNCPTGGGVFELYGSSDGIVSNFIINKAAAGISLNNPVGKLCSNILFTDGTMDSITNYAISAANGENIVYDNITVLNSVGGIYAEAGRVTIKNCYFNKSTLYVQTDVKVDVIDSYFRKSNITINGNGNGDIPITNINHNVFDSSYVHYHNQGNAGWYALGSFYKNSFVNKGNLANTIYGATDSIDIDGSAGETITLPQLFAGASLTGVKNVVATSTGITLTTIQAGISNQEIKLIFNYPAGTSSIVNDKLDHGSGNIKLLRSKSERFIGGDVLTLFYNADSSVWQEKSRSGTAYGFNIEAIDGWYQQDVSASQTNVILSKSAGTLSHRFYINRNCYLRLIGVVSNEARTAGTLSIAPNVSGSDWTLYATLDGTNTTKKITEFERGVYYLTEGQYITLTITTDGSWSPTTADIIAWIEVEY